MLAGGILLSELLAIPPHWLFASLSFLFASALIMNARFPLRLSSLILSHVLIVSLGMTLAAVERERIGHRRFSSGGEGDTLTAFGVLEDAPFIQGKSVRMTVGSDLTVRRQSRDSSERRFLVLASEKRYGGLVDTWDVGASVVVRGTLAEYPRPRNPGEFDYGRYLALNGVDGILWLTDTLCATPSRSPWRPAMWFGGQRAAFGRIFDRLHGPEQSGFLRGVLFGDRTEIASDLKEAFVNTGTIHILAVSGSNVAVIALALYMLLGLFRIPKRWIVALTILGLLYYMMVTGASSSIVRATIMGCVFLIGQTLERKVDIYNSISVAAMVILLLSPSQLFDVGFQLSFAAVLSIVMLYPKLNLLIQRIPSRFEEIKAIDYVLKLLAVSLAAQLGTLPFTAYYFERISLVSLAANLVVVPVAGINLVLGCLTLGASAVSEWVAGTYAALNEILVSLLLGFVQAGASVPYAVVETAGFSMAGTAVFYCVLVGVFNLGNRVIRKYVVTGLLLVGTGSVWSALAGDAQGILRLTVLDVGQGDALLVEFPNKATMLIDAGPKAPGFDSGEKIVVPFLKRHGVSLIDRLVISHPHSDHIGGMLFLLKHMNVGALLEADTMTASRLHGAVRAAVTNTNSLKLIRAGMELSPDPSVRVYCLSPSEVVSDRNLNNRSVVLKIQYGLTSVMLPGDAEKEEEEHVYSRFGSFLDSDILKAGHHGSATSSSLLFLDGITPNFAIISVGRRNKFGHPSRDVLKEMHGRNMRIFRTDAEGAIVFESDGSRWTRSHWGNQE